MSKFLNENGLLYLWGKIKETLSGKVDKETGKGLSANDFTDADKTKLDSLEQSVQIQAITNAEIDAITDGE